MGEQFLEVPERQRLASVLAGLYDFTDQGARGRRVFIQESAGLGRFVPGIDLSGDPRTVSRDLIGRFERFGVLPERPTYHALGALLSALLDTAELGVDDAAFVAGLIVRYGLVADPTYLQRLREAHHIDEPAVREPPAAAKAPAREAPGARANEPAFEPRVADQAALETILGSEDNFLDVHLLRGALYCARAVGRVELPEGEAKGTGFLLGPDLLLTNQHVLREQAHLEEAVVRFDFQIDASGVAPKGTVLRLKPDFYFASPAEELDYALVRLVEKPLQAITVEGEQALLSMTELLSLGKHKGYLVAAPRRLVAESRVNILQHPDGKPLKVVLTQNRVVYSTESRVQYAADTMEGSSGSPVFNQNWEVVALHHSGSPYPPDSVGDVMRKAWKGRFRVNEGVPMRAILEDFKRRQVDRYLPRG